MVHLELNWVLDDFLQMRTLFHMILTSENIMSNMSNLFVFSIFIIFSSLPKIIHVFVVIIIDNNVAMLLSDLENNRILRLVISVIWEQKHELVIICHVVILFYFSVSINTTKCDRIFLNQELGVLMNQEWIHVFVLPLAVFIWIN